MKTAKQAGYMELEGATKDGECKLVAPKGGISSRLGCCNLYEPIQHADEFRCGECEYARIKPSHPLMAMLSGQSDMEEADE